MGYFAELLSYLYLGLFVIAVGFFNWLGKEGLTQFFTSSLRLEFDRKLAEIQSELRQKELEFSTELQVKTREINELKDGVLSNSKLRKQGEYERRIAALEVVWKAVVKAKKLEIAVSFISVLDIDATSEQMKVDRSKFDTFCNVTKPLTPENLEFLNAVHEVRPYVPDVVWSLFSAYQSLFGLAAVVCTFMQKGTPISKSMVESPEFDRILKNAMPELSRLDRTLTIKHAHLVMVPLVERILATIKKEMAGEDITQAEISEAKRIQDAVQSLKGSV